MQGGHGSSGTKRRARRREGARRHGNTGRNGRPDVGMQAATELGKEAGAGPWGCQRARKLGG
jgi:hypothetical protein